MAYAAKRRELSLERAHLRPEDVPAARQHTRRSLIQFRLDRFVLAL